VTQNHIKYILFLLCLCILQANLESRLYSKINFLMHTPISHNRTISLCLWSFSFSFKSHNRIYPPFHQLYMTYHNVQIQANQRLSLCIDPGRGVLFTIISANLACLGKTEGKENIFYWIRFNNSLQFFAVLSRYFCI
jgi:hypothetical protein